MNRIVSWIKDNWTDSVWSKVFSGIILSILGSIGLFLKSIYDKVDFKTTFQNTLTYLQKTKVELSLLSIILFILVFVLLVVVPLLVWLAKINLPFINQSKKELIKFIEGYWSSKRQIQQNATDHDFIYINNKLMCYRNSVHIYTLRETKFDKKTRKIEWKKYSAQSGKMLTTESLNVVDNETLKGQNELNKEIEYKRFRP